MTLRYHAPAGGVVFELSGKDALRYAGARLTADVRTLAVGSGTLAAALSPQGRTEGVFLVCRVSDDRFLLVCDGGEPDQVVAAFRRYVVADRLAIDDLSDERRLVHVTALGSEAPVADELGLGTLPEAEGEVVIAGGLTAVRRTRTRRAGLDLVVPRPEFAALKEALARAGASPYAPDDFTRERIEAGVVSFPEELNPSTPFAESTDVPGGGPRPVVGQGKGCYVGQEVVEKSDAYGRVPRRLVRVRFEKGAAVEEGQTLSPLPGQEACGRLVTVAHGGAPLAFATVKSASASAGAEVYAGETRGVLF